MRKAAEALSRHAYLILCLALVPLVAWRVATGDWLADFWEHAAVVAELAASPLDPAHPMLAIDAPHALTSPYHLVLAAVTRISGFSAVAVVGVAALVNLAFFVVALRVFVRLFTRQPWAPPLALLFTLLLWGPDAWVWSGFFHVRSFSVVMPFPSTFATASAFVALWAARAYLLSGRTRWAAATAGLGLVILLSHPPTFAFLAIGIAALTLSRLPRTHRWRAAALGAAVAGTAAVAVIWPYYPLVELVGADPAGYLRDNDDLLALRGTLIKTGPALIGLPFLYLRFRRRSRDPLVAIFVGAVLAYAVARIGQVGSLATMIRFVVLALHVAAADGIARYLHDRGGRVRELAMPVIVASAVVLLVAMTVSAPGRQVAGLVSDEIPDLEYLATAVPDDDVVMTDPITALEVPAWGPKVVAWHYAMPYVADREARREAVDDFFADEEPATRGDILEHYCARWVLLVPERLEGDVVAEGGPLDSLGRLVAEGPDGRSMLYEVDLRCAGEED